MNVSPAFAYAAGELVAGSSLSELEARGTIRLAIKQAGFDAKDVTAAQMCAVFETIIPNELEIRGVEPSELCRRILVGLKSIDDGRREDRSPDAVFRHLAGDDRTG